MTGGNPSFTYRKVSAKEGNVMEPSLEGNAVGYCAHLPHSSHPDADMSLSTSFQRRHPCQQQQITFLRNVRKLGMAGLTFAVHRSNTPLRGESINGDKFMPKTLVYTIKRDNRRRKL